MRILTSLTNRRMKLQYFTGGLTQAEIVLLNKLFTFQKVLYPNVECLLSQLYQISMYSNIASLVCHLV